MVHQSLITSAGCAYLAAGMVGEMAKVDAGSLKEIYNTLFRKIEAHP